MCETHARCVRLGRSGSVAKYGRFNLPGSFVPGGGRLGLKYGSSRKIRDIWQPYVHGRIPHSAKYFHPPRYEILLICIVTYVIYLHLFIYLEPIYNAFWMCNSRCVILYALLILCMHTTNELHRLRYFGPRLRTRCLLFLDPSIKSIISPSRTDTRFYYQSTNHINCNVQQLYWVQIPPVPFLRLQIWLIQQYKTCCYLIQIYFSSFSTANLWLDLAVRARTDNNAYRTQESCTLDLKEYRFLDINK